MPVPSRFHPASVLGAYAEPLVAGARVAVLGAATDGLAAALVERGARLVHVYDPEPARVAEAVALSTRRSVVYAPLPDDGDLGVRDGAFDLVVIPDLTIAPDAARALLVARRALAAAGVAIVASPNPEAGATAGRAPLGYYELYDAIALQFPAVRMAGLVPFLACAITDFAAPVEPDVSIDTSLAEGGARQPLFFVAIASARDVRIDPYALLELPSGDLATDEPAPAPEPVANAATAEQAERLVALVAERDAARERAATADERAQVERVRREQAEARLEASLDAARRGEARTGERDASARERDAEIGRLTAKLDEQAARRGEAERRAAELAERGDRATEALARITVVEAEAAKRVASVEAEVAQRVAVAEAEAAKRVTVAEAEAAKRVTVIEAEAAKRVAVAQGAQAEAERRFAAVQSAAERPGDGGDERAAEVAALEAHLAEQGRQLRELEREVRRLHALGRDLIAELDERPGDALPDVTSAELEARLDRLAGEAARRAADLVAAEWKIGQLERRLGLRAAGCVDSGG